MGRPREAAEKVEALLGRKLPSTVQIHHVDGNRNNNENSNLVVCENQEYHRLLHVRQRALKACGDKNKRKCYVCKQYDHVNNLQYRKEAGSYFHKQCARDYANENYSYTSTGTTMSETMEVNRKIRAISAYGDPAARQCIYCKKWDIPPNIRCQAARPSSWFHSDCYNEHRREYRKNKKLNSIKLNQDEIDELINFLP